MLDDVLSGRSDTSSAPLRVDELTHLLSPDVDVDEYLENRGQGQPALAEDEAIPPENLSGNDPVADVTSKPGLTKPSIKLGDLDRELTELVTGAEGQIRQLSQLINMCREAIDHHCAQERAGRIRPERLQLELGRRAEVEQAYYDLIQQFDAVDQEITERKNDLVSRFQSYLMGETEQHFPEWLEEEEGGVGRKTLLEKVAISYDYHPSEIDGVNDIRLFRLFRDAMAYQDLMNNRDLAANKVKDKPDFLRPGTQGAALSEDATRKARLFQKLKETGDPKYAIALI